MNVIFPCSIDEFLTLAAQLPEAVIMAGGTDLMVRMRSNTCLPHTIICLEKVTELQTIELSADQLRIGASVSLAHLLQCPEIEEFSVLMQAISVLGSPLIRNMATLGGNVCTASPAGDSLPALYVLDAMVELTSASGVRKMEIASFILGPGRTYLQPGEILSAILIPVPESGGFHHYEKIGQRKALAISMAGMAALVHLDGDNIQKIRLAWGSVGPTIVQSSEVEQILQGNPLSLDRLTKAASLVRKAVSPISDIRATADYRRQIAGNLLLRLAAITGKNSVCSR